LASDDAIGKNKDSLRRRRVQRHRSRRFSGLQLLARPQLIITVEQIEQIKDDLRLCGTLQAEILGKFSTALLNARALEKRTRFDEIVRRDSAKYLAGPYNADYWCGVVDAIAYSETLLIEDGSEDEEEE
jgi:hypothetical protein